MPKTTITLILILLCGSVSLMAQEQLPLHLIEIAPNATVKVQGQLTEGQTLSDLSWAWNSQNACFVSTKQDLFNGHHVLYRTQLPRRAELFIKLIPDQPDANMSLYAYSGGGGAVVPDLASCVSCEADFSGNGQWEDRPVREVSLRAINNPYPITIGVAGAEGRSEGSYTLELRLVGGETPETRVQEAIPRFRLQSSKGDTLTYEGELREGALMHDLSWAWNSQNACFVQTRADQFNGHHIQYITELPCRSEMTIRLIPKDGVAQLGLYAYSMGGTARFAPDLSSCVSCEASFASPYGNEQSVERSVQLRAINNPYQVVIGVAGSQQLQEGSYYLQIILK